MASLSKSNGPSMKVGGGGSIDPLTGRGGGLLTHLSLSLPDWPLREDEEGWRGCSSFFGLVNKVVLEFFFFFWGGVVS